MILQKETEMIVNALIEDMDINSVMLGSALFCLSDSQKASLKKRWVSIIEKNRAA